MARRTNYKRIFILTLSFIIISVCVFFGIQFITKTGVFKVPGIVIYDESLSEEEKNTLQAIFTEETELDKDVKISAYETNERPELKEGEFITEITVPVADYYDIREDVSEYAPNEYKEISVNDLTDKVKLLKKDDKYFLDDPNSGATFRILTFTSEKYKDEIGPLVKDKYTKTFPTSDTILTFAQTGVTAMSRGMNKKLAEVGDAKYFSEKIADYLAGFDLTHTSNESSFSDYATSSNICSDHRFMDTLNHIGLDIVELTGNHNVDCGDEAASNTIDTYTENNIKIVGGGKSADEAKVPLEINEKNTGITMLAYNLSTGGATTDDTPGANEYNEENAKQEIANAKARGDIVIVDIQYYECAAYASEYEDNTCDYADSSAGDQVGFFHHLIDLGADVVVGTSAHQPQTYELYGDGAIYYGLGNLFFDQVWWPGTTRSLILAHYFYNGKLLQTKVIPTIYDSNMQTRIYEEAPARAFLARLISERPRQ
ncbi:CapA family protein [Candidatus Saccharibacteria bacterium]|nr:CapA family protein [Candidatus Saccharibacteria bacterium]